VFLRNFAFVDEEFGHELMTIGITKLRYLPKGTAHMWASDADKQECQNSKLIVTNLGLWANQTARDWAYGVAK
jgi:hypothetical protein